MSDPPARLNEALSGRYRIERKIGEGGMASVYLAEDLKHERQVALKILRPELAAVIGGERFLAEIKTTANLQHPHILPLFDSGEADGFLYYVMPYIAGENLRDRIEREGQLGVDEAIKIARNVGEALDYAHRNDIIHRDIKPANILLHDGNPLVADFGIALAVSAAGGGRMTETGLSLGTPHYMSPEQASADRDLNARSDVYSLGCVLYEMLAGHPPHTGPSAQSVLVRILTEDPRPVSEVRRSVPPNVAAAVTKSIEKLPADRFESAREFVDALGDPGYTYVAATRPAASTTRGATAASAPPASPAWMKAVLAVLAVTSVLFGWMALGSGPQESVSSPGPLSAVLLDSLDGWTLNAAVGPGGAIVADRSGGSGGPLEFRAPGDLEWRPLEGTEGRNAAPEFSPDGEWLAFFQEEEGGSTAGWALRRIPAAGGPVSTLVEPELGFPQSAPAWGEDGWLYLSDFDFDREVGTVHRVPEAGGAPEVISEFEGYRVAHLDALPGGEALSVTLGGGNDAASNHVVLLNLATRDTTTLVRDGVFANWVSSGHFVYAHAGGALYAMPFDLERLEATGPGVPVLDDVSVAGSFYGRFRVSRDGMLVYARGEPVLPGGRLAISFGLQELDGTVTRLPLEPTDHGDPSLSPDGNRIAYIREDQVWIYDIDLGSNRQFTEDGRNHHNPVWSPDGTEIAFASRREGDESMDIYVRPADRSAPARRVGGSDGDEFPLQWLDDGSILVMGFPEDILRIRLDGDGTAEPVLDADWAEVNASVSPDGRWLAYNSDESGAMRMYLRPWPGLIGKIEVTEDEEADGFFPSTPPLWSADSRTVYFERTTGRWSATMTDESASDFELRQTELYPRAWSMHPDGRFLVETSRRGSNDGTDPLAAPQLVAIANFLDMVRERTGGGN